jgi:hypothetical protein
VTVGKDSRMTVDERFSADAFSHLDPGSVAMKRLIEDLQAAVAADLQPAVSSAMARIVENLNGMGHQLALYGAEPTCIDYHDGSDPPPGAHCRLRLAVDIVVSLGYADIAGDPAEAE